MTRSLVSLANDNRVENNLNEVLAWCMYTMGRPEEEEDEKKQKKKTVTIGSNTCTNHYAMLFCNVFE